MKTLRSLFLGFLLLGAPLLADEALSLDGNLVSQIQDAVVAGKANDLEKLVQDHPELAGLIAQTALAFAHSYVETHPDVALAIAQIALTVAHNIATDNPTLAATLASNAVTIAKTPEVTRAEPNLAAEVTRGALEIAKTPEVQKAAPELARAIIVSSIQQVITAYTAPVNLSTTPITPIDPTVVSPAGG